MAEWDALAGLFIVYLWLGIVFGKVSPGDVLLGSLVVYSLLLLPLIPFLTSAYRLAISIPPQRRKFRPATIWLGVVPLLNLVWLFVIPFMLARDINAVSTAHGFASNGKTIGKLGGATSLLYLCVLFLPLKLVFLLAYAAVLLMFLAQVSAYRHWLHELPAA